VVTRQPGINGSRVESVPAPMSAAGLHHRRATEHADSTEGAAADGQARRTSEPIPGKTVGFGRFEGLAHHGSNAVQVHSKTVPRLISALLYVTVAGLLGAGAVTNVTSRLIGGSADAAQHVWFLAWLPFALTHHLNPLLTSYLDHPLQVNLMWNNSTPLLGLLAWPVTATLGPIAAYNIMILLALAASAGVAYVAASRYIRTWWIAFLVGLLYGFSPFMMVQTSGSHLTLVTAFTPPLLLICLDEALVRQRYPAWKLGLALGVVATAQLLIGEELLLTEILVSLLAGILVAVGWPNDLGQRWRAALTSLGVGAGVFAVLGAVPIAIQFFGPSPLQGTTIHPPGSFVGDLLGWVVPTQQQIAAPSSAVALANSFTGGFAEHDAYLGIPLIVLMAVSLFILRRNRWVCLLAVLIGIIAILSLGPNLHVGGTVTGIPLPWALLTKVPLLRDALPNRLALYVFLGAGLLVGLLLDHIWRLRPGWGRRAIPIALALAAIIPLLPIPANSVSVEVPSHLTATLAAHFPSGSAVAILPVATIANDNSMLWQALSDFRVQLPWGYLIHRGLHGESSVDLGGPAVVTVLTEIGQGAPPSASNLSRAELAAQLGGLGVSAVAVGPTPFQSRLVRYLTQLLGRGPQWDGSFAIWTSVALGNQP